LQKLRSKSSGTRSNFRRIRLSTPQFFFWQRVPRILV
jgi:hypothetical protein